MPRFEPFRALRYSGVDLDLVLAPPYDVLSDDDRHELGARHPANIVHVDVPIESDGPDRYEVAGATLRSWIERDVLTVDDVASFTIYRMEFVDAQGRSRLTSGVIGALEVVDEGAGGVLPHERTTPKAKTDRLDLTRATLTNLSPVWGLSLAAGLSDLLATPGRPMGEVVVEGVRHVFERVDDPDRVDAISKAVSAHEVVIADGHHRYAIARTFRDEQREHDTGTHGAADTTMAYVGELISEQLSVAAIHRLYSGVDFAALRDTLARSFDLEPAGPIDPAMTNEMDRRGSLVLVGSDGQGTWLTPRADAFAGVRDLDGSRLEHALTSLPHEVTYQHGVEHVTEAVRSGRGGTTAGVLIRPVTVAEIRRTADEGLLMPPKSTFFTPKLRTGPVMRPMFEI